jgi:hypothetical protein
MRVPANGPDSAIDRQLQSKSSSLPTVPRIRPLMLLVGALAAACAIDTCAYNSEGKIGGVVFEPE